MASNPPPFPVEDDTDEDFFDRLVNDDDDDLDFQVNRPLIAAGPVLTDQIESDETKAFANLTINESDNEGKIIFDSTVGGNQDRVDDDTSKGENVEESGNPSKCENREAEVSDVTVVGKNTDEGFSDLALLSKTSSGSGVPGVKEVDWNVFHADSAQNDNVFGSFDEFGGENAGDAFGNMVGNISNNVSQVAIANDVHGSSFGDGSVNYGQHHNEGYNDGIAADQSSIMQDLSSNQYWEDQYPGWKYDPSTGQWYQVDSNDPGSVVQSNIESDISSTQGVAEFSYMQKAAEPIAHVVSEAGRTESVSNWNQASKASDAAETATNWTQVSQVSSDGNGVPSDWNQASHDNNGYPPHMVFDPQYPGWYYDTITQNWCTLESYTTLGLSNAEVQDGMNQDAYALTDTFSQNISPQESIIHGQGNSYNSQGLHQSWGESVSNYDQQSSTMWLPESVSSSEATTPYIGKQVAENNYGRDVSVSTHGTKQSSVHFGLGRNEFTMPSQFLGDMSLKQHLNNSIINQNEQKHFSSDYYKDHKPLNFQQQPIQNARISFAPASGRSSAGRPAHALVAFGFGGKLVVMKHNHSTVNLNFGSQDPVGGSISVLNLAELVNGNIDTLDRGMAVRNYFQALCQQPVPGPLTSGSVGSKELNKWIDERITNLMSTDMDYRNTEVLRLLLSLLKIACQYYGKLRSPYGTDAVLKENEAPESAVAKLFALAKTNSSQFSQYGAVAHCLQQLPSEGQLRVAAAEVQNLLVSGRKNDALQRAQEGQLWGPALVLASQIGHQFYVETVKQMALRQLIPGSPLRTLCLLIAGQPADAFSADSSPISSMAGAINTSQQPVQFGANVMLDNWEENLAVITANRTKDDELVLMHLGDCLWKERSDIIAAHICYLIAEASFEPYSDSARMCLLGADHWKFPRTYASPEAIQRTEIYEYSKMLGNSQFVLFPFQPYKFVYALMLAEVGRISEALKYCQAVLKSLKTGRTPEVETLRHLVSSLEERIKAHQQGGFSTNLAPKEFIGKLLNLLDNTAHRVVGGLPPSVPTTVGTVHDNGNHYQSSGPRESTIQSSMFIPSLVPSQSMEPISELTADRNQMAMQTRSVSEPDIWKSPVQADTSKEASSTELQDKTSAAGIKSRFGRFGFGSQLLQKTVGLVLKPRQDKQAKLGESNKFYYDEKLKRWVEEGAEAPAEEAALPPPPPTTAVFQNGTPEYHLKNALQSEAFHSNGSPEFKSSSSLDNSSGMPPIPPATNQYSARGRMGIRSRYVDTFNKSGGNATSAIQPPSVPTVKLPSGGNPKFFVPAPISNAEQAVDTPVNDEQNPSSTDESSSTSPLNDSFQSNAPPALTMQRFASMKNISNKELNDNGTFSTHSRRTASWSGSFNGSFSPPLHTPSVGALGIYSSPPSDPSLVHSSVSGGSFGDGLHEVEL